MSFKVVFSIQRMLSFGLELKMIVFPYVILEGLMCFHVLSE
jgi:hypothetical protein